MRSLALTLDEQRACVRGECNGTLVDASSVRLIGGADARAGLVVARVTRIAVRLTAWWAVPAVCTRALCGEGWDVALLELDPSCAHGELPCVPPVHLASVPATIGLAPLAVGFGAHPGSDQRAEFQLSLSGSGGGVRRSSAARVWQVASRQLLQAELSARPGERAGPFCDGDLGAALLTNRSGEWEVEGLHVPGSLVHAQPPTDAAASCAAPSGRVLSAHVVRCWLESIARTWGIGPIVQAHVAECGELDFYPPELAEMRIVGQRGRGGLFIEMGAADGVTGSNTYMLEMCFNWTGLLIEGSPTNFELMRTRSGRRSVMVHSSVCNETHTVPFTKHGGLVSGRPDIMLPSFMKRFSNSHRLGDDGRGIVQVPCQPMNAIMAAHGFATEHFHYFSLDVEGAEDRVLEGTDATRFSLVETEELPRGGSVDRVEVEDPEKEARVVASTELVAAGGADVEDVGASTAGGAAKEAPGAPQVKTSSEPAVEVAATAAVDVAE
ncbi:methyltransferase fkbm family [Chrysochromulina tobinii]|uniref:Methyltransferase fkbm family n=1 Tax=Chrysochromulina tobinii TaxID=1460289 RepID=A0A0M0JAQ4_9EUKA|nr:methyltransferase fkbm family [Chrysochromulina tobinii]|eukprot:KOO23674.1 methyltransferase fkbm family [Chrysochromulina sp. CCMP291]